MPEPAWQLTESISTTEEFDLTTSFGLSSAAGDFIFSDILGESVLLGRLTIIAGVYQESQRLSGKYEEVKRLAGKYESEHILRGDI